MLLGLVNFTNRLAIFGMLLMIFGISTFSFTLLLYAATLTKRRN